MCRYERRPCAFSGETPQGTMASQVAGSERMGGVDFGKGLQLVF